MLLLPASASLLFWYFIKSRSLNDLFRRLTILVLISLGVITLPIVLAIFILSIPYILAFIFRNFVLGKIHFKSHLQAKSQSQYLNKITTTNLAIYHSHNGSMDSFVRSWRADDESVINDYQWIVIDNYLQDIKLERQGLLSKEYSENLEVNIFDGCATTTAVIKLRRMSLIDYHKSEKGNFSRLIDWLFP